jgi:probable dihydroxyacetone kinase regulator
MIKRRTTEQLLADSIVELMKTLDLSKITVQQIVDNCDVTRQTFYRYFYDKYQLVNWIFESEVEEIIHQSSLDDPWEELLAKMLTKMKDKKHFYHNILHCNSQAYLQNLITDYTRRTYEKEIEKRGNLETIDKSMEFSLKFNSFGAVGSIFDWIAHGMEESPTSLAKRILNNMPYQMKQFFQ